MTYNIHNIFLKGGEIVQMSPAEVVPPGGHGGSSGQDQQGCGHKVKLHSFFWPKINTMEAIKWWIAIGGGESLCNWQCESLVDMGQRWRSLLLQPMALVFGSFPGKSDRSIGCCGDATRPAQWRVGPHAQQRGADIYADLNLVTSRGGHNKPTQLTKIVSKCRAGV